MLPVPPVSPVPPVFPAVVGVVVGGTVVAVVVVVGGTVVGIVLVVVGLVVVGRVVVVVVWVVVVTDAVVVVTDTVVAAGAVPTVVPGLVTTLVVVTGECVRTCNREPPGNESVSALSDGAAVVDVDGAAAVVVGTEGTYSCVTGVTGSASVGSDVVCREKSAKAAKAANTNAASKHPTKPSVMLRATCGLPSGHG